MLLDFEHLDSPRLEAEVLSRPSLSLRLHQQCTTVQLIHTAYVIWHTIKIITDRQTTK